MVLNQILIKDFFVENGDRLIYDYKNQFQQRVTLVRQEGEPEVEDEMTYGGDGNKEFKDFASAIDVVAHELTHGVTQFSGYVDGVKAGKPKLD